MDVWTDPKDLFIRIITKNSKECLDPSSITELMNEITQKSESIIDNVHIEERYQEYWDDPRSFTKRMAKEIYRCIR
jgi:hypothetical protein